MSEQNSTGNGGGLAALFKVVVSSVAALFSGGRSAVAASGQPDRAKPASDSVAQPKLVIPAAGPSALFPNRPSGDVGGSNQSLGDIAAGDLDKSAERMNVNRKAFLDMIAHAEGTSLSSATKFDGYDVIVTGVNGVPEVFADMSTHPFANGRPAKLIRRSTGITGSLYSTASGRYQEKLTNYTHYAALLSLPDFGADSQDAIAIQQIKEFGGLPLIDAGQFEAAVAKVAPLWASLPGAGYNQPERSIAVLRVAYAASGGTFTEQA